MWRRNKYDFFSQEEHWKVEQFDPAEEMEEEEEEEVLFLDIPPLGFLIPTNWNLVFFLNIVIQIFKFNIPLITTEIQSNFASSKSDGSNTTDHSNCFFSPVNFDVNSLSNIPSLDLLITTTEINHEIEITISTALSSNYFFSSFELRLVLWFDEFCVCGVKSSTSLFLTGSSNNYTDGVHEQYLSSFWKP